MLTPPRMKASSRTSWWCSGMLVRMPSTTISSNAVRMRTALDEIVVDGIRTNIPLHHQLVRDEAFMRGGVSIHYLEKKLKS